MKKRFLSAALALAMVLTLLPATVFAGPIDTTAKASETSPASGVTQVQYVYGTDYSKLDKNNNPISNAWAWQWTDTTTNKTHWTSNGGTNPGGVVTGTAASGVWYANMTDLTNDTVPANVTLRTTSFTLLNDFSLTDACNATGLSVNTFGHTLTLPSDIKKVTSITITDTWYTQYGGDRGHVSGLSRTVTPYNSSLPAASQTMSTSGLTLNITGAGVTGGINLVGRSNRVTLTDVDVAGGITLDGKTVVNTTTTTGTTTVYSCDAQYLTINPKATVPYDKSTIAGNIVIDGNNSSVTLNGVTGTSTVTVTGVGGSVTASNGTSLGAVTVATGSDATVNPTLTLASAPASVIINDATVAGISYTKAGATYTGASSFTVNAQGKVTGAISTDNGTVSLTSANVAGVTVKAGTLNISGPNGTAGAIMLGDSAASKVNFNFSATGYKGTTITKGTDTVLTIGSNWPASRSNEFTTLSLGNYTGQGIKGGVFATPAETTAQAAWFSPDLQFIRDTNPSSGPYAYYGKQELAAAIADAGGNAAVAGTIAVIGWKGTSAGATANYAKFYNSMVDVSANTTPVAQLAYGVSTAIYLPNMINGSPVATWTDASGTTGSGTAETYGVNELVSLSSGSTNVKLVIQSSGAAVTRLTNATVSSSAPNNNITVTMSNNQITLSGAVGQAAFEDVQITCTTDLIGADGQPVTFPVVVSFDTNTKAATFSTLGITPPPLGVTIKHGSNTILVGDNTYTLSVSGLAKPASDLQVAGISSGAYANTKAPSISGKGIVVTVNVPGMNNTAKTNLIKALSDTGASFEWTTSPAMQQVVNQAMTTITTNNQIANWATAAQRAAWNLNNRGKTPTEQELIDTGYTTVLVEPYLAVTVTAFNQSGTMTANLVPSYRVIVVGGVAAYTGSGTGEGIAKNKTGFTAEGYYIAQPGRALGTPITDLTKNTGADGVTITFATGLSSYTGFSGSTVMHQDGTYAYTTTDGEAFTLTRGGKTGLGTVVFNTTPALVTLTRTGSLNTNGAGGMGYDNLQAAVDDTLPQADATKQDKITVTSDYKGDGKINVTGTARTFTIETKGMTNITRANENFLVGVDSTGHVYTVQLQQSVATADGTVEIVVSTANNGYVTVDKSKAKAGETVTITSVPATGFQLSSLIATTNTNVTVAVKAADLVNQYTFVVPEKVTKITLAPSFGVNDTKVGFNVASNIRGSAGVITGTADGRAEQGSTVTVTVVPNGGYRTMGITAQTNTGANVYATRTGVNQFQMTVPSGATTVTVAPSFDVDNGTPFTDVPSTYWASNEISWIYNKGYTTGYGNSYTFAPTLECTRWEMVTFLWKAAGYPQVNITNPFKDVNPTYPDSKGQAYQAIMWAVSKGLVETSSGYFYPTSMISRADAVVILYKHAGSPTVSGTSGFADVASNAYYAKAVTWARQKGLTNGYNGNTYFRPSYTVTREQIATFLYRAFG